MKAGTLALLIAGLLVMGLPLVSMAGPAPDMDSDGVPDVVDNCKLVSNASPFDCDGDADGYGNVCDADINNAGGQNSNDIAPFLTGLGNLDPVSDINCQGGPNSNDIAPFLTLLGSSTTPGPSGLSCAGSIPCCADGSSSIPCP
jgi:hypothetical protein